MVQHYRDDTQHSPAMKFQDDRVAAQQEAAARTAEGPAVQPTTETGPDETALQEGDRRPLHRANVKTSAATEVDPAYRGFKSGAAFFGWLIAVGLTVLLTGIVSAIAAAVDYAITIDRSAAEANAETIGAVSGGVLVVMLAIAYYSGGYVAGRLARFDGARQGLGVWGIGLVVTLIVAGIVALAGSQYDVLSRVDLPSIPVAQETLTTGSMITGALVLVVTLLAAVIGGKAGQRYHRRIDNSWS
ncbi:hypothetical protein GCM10009744_08130 [Kribbella alba]|uniref:Major facilitator superfamily (MFS) profile domain-containing protein n=1 Tax=Kribbella alba TaxID=190197 RepID=A0ABN2EZ19_9ACTN